MFLIPRRKSAQQNGLATVDGLFDNLLDGFLGRGPLGLFEGPVLPRIDMKETKAEYVLKADLPGVEMDQLDVSVSDGVLTIRGEVASESEKSDENDGYIYRERSFGSIRRSLNLPEDVDETAVQADYKDGTLTVILPRKEGQGHRKIDVKHK